MGLYKDFVIPWLIHLTMGNKEAARHRGKMVPTASGRVLEVGIGSGLNLPFYGDAVKSVVGLDPSRTLLSLAGKSRLAKTAPFAFELVEGSATDMPFESKSFDTVLTTWTLCSIEGADRALAEMRRVLTPGGRLVFVEHGRSPDAKVRHWQDRLNPAWHALSGGCNMNRDIAGLIGGAGFVIDGLETGYLVKGPRVLTYIYEGQARLV